MTLDESITKVRAAVEAYGAVIKDEPATAGLNLAALYTLALLHAQVIIQQVQDGATDEDGPEAHEFIDRLSRIIDMMSTGIPPLLQELCVVCFAWRRESVDKTQAKAIVTGQVRHAAEVFAKAFDTRVELVSTSTLDEMDKDGVKDLQ